MKAEIIAVGTEILLGQIVNTNASFLARQLALLGIDAEQQQVVGDNGERLDAALTLAEGRADLVILIGGLGPTADDITKQVLAQHIGKPLVTNFQAIEKLLAFAQQRQTPLTANDRVQAALPFDAQPLANRVGLAVGAISETPKATYVLLPGPPREFTVMVEEQLTPYLLTHRGEQQVLKSKVLRFYGIGESLLTTDLADLIDAQSEPTIASYIKEHEVTLRLTAKAADDAAAEALIAPIEQEILAREGQYFYGYGDDNSLAQELANALANAHLTITAAESLTAGAFQAALADIPGISTWFKGGFVTYSNHTKATLLGLDEATIDRDGAVSEATALAMAEAAREKVDADLAVSMTGVAGPGPDDGVDAGTVWIGLAKRGEKSQATLYHFPGARNDVRDRAVKAAMFAALRAIQPQ
ncbi:competence/damage-inducible protein A [Lacticaseibacillus yichunensis]|uniref:Putative competence-damage inducible protein n=1 Tax=Lacticaseibacillus yichunensis TaxID=2486015 RepID=A0ABW4CLZ0_9LACO|nr:competence/damage-inducible protein A [Lacticaseibacillus yichunensis]